MCAMVADKYKLMPWDVRKLTFHQLNHILFHETDKHGNLVPIYDANSEPDFQSSEEQIRAPWIAAGLTQEQRDVKWREFLEADDEEHRLEEKGHSPDEVQKRMAEFRAKQISRRGPAW